MTALRMCVVGTGALGRHHARILSGLPGVELVGVADTNALAGQAVAQSCGTNWVSDYRELVGAVDAAVVAVPTFAHLAVASAFLRQGVDVLVEKPIAASVAQARQLVHLAHDQGAILQVGHVERYNPAFAAARPHIGLPKYIRTERFSPFAFRSTDIGVVLDLMIHDIDLVLSLEQTSLSSVEAFGISILGANEDCVQARLTFLDGCIADLVANRVSPTIRRTMQVWSSNGCTDLDFASREVQHYALSGALRFGLSPIEKSRQPDANLEQLKADLFGTYIQVHRPLITPCDQLTEELLAFTDSVRTRESPAVGGEQALEAMLVAEQILEQVANHQWEGTFQGPIGPLAQFRGVHKLAG